MRRTSSRNPEVPILLPVTSASIQLQFLNRFCAQDRSKNKGWPSYFSIRCSSI